MRSMLIFKKWMCLAIVALVATGLGAPSSMAAPHKAKPATATQPKARELRDKGIVALNLSHYEDAVKLLEEAYELSREPSILFDLVQAHRLNGNPERALVLCASFLRTRPALTPRNQEEIDKTVAELGIIVEQIRLEGGLAKRGKVAPARVVAKDDRPAEKAPVEPPAVEEVESVTAVASEPVEASAKDTEAEKRSLPPSAAKPIETAKADESVRVAELLKSEPAPLGDRPRSSWLRSPWVWAAAGVVVAGVAAAVIGYESTKDPGAPRTSWGSQKVF